MAVTAVSAADAIVSDKVIANRTEDSVTIEDEFSGVVDSANGIYEDLQEGDYENAINATLKLIEDIAISIHNLIGKVMAVLGKECAFCGEIHSAEDEEVADTDILL